MVQDWVNNTTTNFGMLINSDPLAAAVRYRTFSSSEHPQAAERPKLEITYFTEGGIPNPPTGLVVQLQSEGCLFRINPDPTLFSPVPQSVRGQPEN